MFPARDPTLGSTYAAGFVRAKTVAQAAKWIRIYFEVCPGVMSCQHQGGHTTPVSRC